jgi:hypothetical protein
MNDEPKDEQVQEGVEVEDLDVPEDKSEDVGGGIGTPGTAFKVDSSWKGS